MAEALAQLFTKHPKSVDETYFQHMRFAGWFAAQLAMAAGAALIHAVFPFLFEKTAGRMIERMHHRMHNRTAH